MNWNPAVLQRERADDQCEDHRHRRRGRPDDEGVGPARQREHARGIGADAEEGGLPEGDEPGIAEQQIDRKRRHAVDRDLRGKARVVDVAGEGHRQRDEQQRRVKQSAAIEAHLSPDAPRRARCG